jgi:hypothetical protein
VLALHKNENSNRKASDVSATPVLTPHSSSAQTILRMKLLNANKQALLVGQNELQGRINYLVGNDPQRWRRNVAAYGKVKYENVYAGVDMIYYGNHNQLEYDFVVQPGADPKDIKLRFAGTDEIRIDGAGNLLIRAGSEEIRQHKPVIYQEVNNARREIAGRYVLNAKREIGFEIGAYDATKPLVIDPVLAYATYFGGGLNQSSTSGIAVDSAGNAYIVGSAGPDTFPIRNGFQTNYKGELSNAFVVKLNAAGTGTLYSSYLGGYGLDVGTAIAVDSSGSAYVTGSASSTDFPTRNALQPNKAGGRSDSAAFIAKVNTNASGANSLIYSTYYGVLNLEGGTGIAVDAEDSAYVTGVASVITVIGIIHTGSEPILEPSGASNSDLLNPFVLKIADSSPSTLQFSSSNYTVAEDGGSFRSPSRALATPHRPPPLTTPHTMAQLRSAPITQRLSARCASLPGRQVRASQSSSRMTTRKKKMKLSI